MKKFIYAEVIENKEIAGPGIFQLVISDTQSIIPGQFYNIYIEDKSLLLPRPISVCESSTGSTKFIYRVVGKGTEKLTKVKKGEIIKILGPLGNGFSIPKDKTISVIVGGGIGIAPLLEVAKHIAGESYVYLGFEDSPFLIDEFRKYSTKLYFSTMSGKGGFHGSVIDLLEHHKLKAKYVYACGPKEMLKRLMEEKYIKDGQIQVSMEERMGCGIGVCLGCGIKIREMDQKDWKYLRVCKDGPVFNGREVIWDEE